MNIPQFTAELSLHELSEYSRGGASGETVKPALAPAAVMQHYESRDAGQISALFARTLEVFAFTRLLAISARKFGSTRGQYFRNYSCIW
jgi:hypothetical protein